MAVNREALVGGGDLSGALEALGVPLLTGASTPRGDLDLGAVVEAGLGDDVPSRVRSCLVPLFLTHTDSAAVAERLVESLPPPAAGKLRRLYTAAVCLQRKWRTRLRLTIGERPLLPDLFGPALGLPPVDQYNGIWALLALEEENEADDGPRGLVAESEAMVLLLMELREREAA